MNALHTPVAKQLLMSIWICSLIIFNNNELIYFSTNEKGTGYVKIIASQHIEPRKSVGLLKKKNISYIKGKNDISLIYFIFF